MDGIEKRKKTIRNIVIFCVLVLAIAFLSPLLGGSPGNFGPGFILWGVAPLFAAIVMRVAGRDWSDAGFKPAFRKNARWYVFVIIACPALMLLTLLMGALLSGSRVEGFAFAPYMNMVLPGMGVFFIFAIFEEFGWRGYLVPKLASLGINDYLAYAIVAAVWATWHLPFIRELSWAYTGSEPLLTFIPRFYLSCFAVSILYGELRILTGSVWPLVLLHCLTNALQHPLAAEYLQITPGSGYLFSFNGLIITAFTGLLGIGLNLWRKKRLKVSTITKPLD